MYLCKSSNLEILQLGLEIKIVFGMNVDFLALLWCDGFLFVCVCLFCARYTHLIFESIPVREIKKGQNAREVLKDSQQSQKITN